MDNVIDTVEDLEEWQRKQRADAEQDIEDFRRLLQFKQNRKWLLRLLEQCRFMLPFPEGTSEAFLREASAKSNIGLWVITEILRADPKMYGVMIKEMNE